ncbi:MAG: hypothetical protein RDV48_04460 [Candidatus Eremiobacteraeota bacterium]|nr:hypothetical protein [Candidatus Eremiobacteraeota bacterium]
MAIICPVCRHELAQDDATVCEKCGNNLVEVRYEKPLKMLKELGLKVTGSPGAFSKEKLEGLYSHIVELLGDIMAHSKAEIDKNLDKLRREFAKTSQIAEDDVDMRAFTEGFQMAQSFVNEGIGMALSALTGMKNFKDIKQGQNMLELATTRIQEGLEHLEQITVASTGMPLPDETVQETPAQVTLAMDSIEKALESLSAYLETRQVDYLKTTLKRLDAASFSLAECLEAMGASRTSGPAPQEEQSPASSIQNIDSKA